MTPGRILVFLILIVGAVGTAVNGGTVYIRLLYLGALLLLVAAAITSLSLRGIKVDRQARAQRGTVGDIFEEHFEVWNDSRLPKLWVEVANETSIPNATGSRVLTFLRAHGCDLMQGHLFGPAAPAEECGEGLARHGAGFHSRAAGE